MILSWQLNRVKCWIFPSLKLRYSIMGRPTTYSIFWNFSLLTMYNHVDDTFFGSDILACLAPTIKRRGDSDHSSNLFLNTSCTILFFVETRKHVWIFILIEDKASVIWIGNNLRHHSIKDDLFSFFSLNTSTRLAQNTLLKYQN